ncbi:DsbA family protein [Curvibacter sp. APW13]|uniref:DsbA family protein n=1 Tax=Curvibacter sp. APW13 TaxID=3077236 RepID=UPI0028DF3F22|nr:DsbA family protein [Curvibacter sp. APW13]MDT8990652.1 DsbA family protein [Curvibacter sp. APW13]
MTIELAYLFDPLCGWCYGASPVVQALGRTAGVQVTLHPTGLFSGDGRTMDDQFAAYAWSNDQRIQQLTGQIFSEAYREQVLNRSGSPFNSTAATLALTAIALDDPAAELPALKQLQEARYVHGQDVCTTEAVAELLSGWGLRHAAQRLRDPDEALILKARNRTQKARQLLQVLGTDGVPALAVRDAAGWRMQHRSLLFGTVEQLMQHLAAAA